MAIPLPDVTILVIDDACHELTRLALIDTLAEIDPGEVLIYSDEPLAIGRNGHWIRTTTGSTETAMRILWYDAPAQIRTSHFLIVQWDGWVLDGGRWDAGWLDLDYLGALWPWHRDGLAVGNGGFSLRSSDLARYLAGHPELFPLAHPEDDVLCRRYRRRLELSGFAWGSRKAAMAFSFEREPPRPAFGFHGIWNIPEMIGQDRLFARLEAVNDYVRGKPEWREFVIAAIKKMGPCAGQIGRRQ